MRNVSNKVKEKIKTHILCSITVFRKSCRLWDNGEKLGSARGAKNDDTTWRIRVACWISKATRARAHTDQKVILIAFPQQQWFRESASVLRRTYIVCVVTCGLVQVLFLSLAVNFTLFSRRFLGTTIWLDLFSGALLNKFAVSVVPSVAGQLDPSR